MILYHGATVRVEHPLCDFGRPDLDFGRGFYLTDLQEQAEEWAAVRLILARNLAY